MLKSILVIIKKMMKVIIFVCTLFIFVNCKHPNEELLLVIEVSRHGARSPGEIFNWTEDPSKNFNDTNELTAYGK